MIPLRKGSSRINYIFGAHWCASRCERVLRSSYSERASIQAHWRIRGSYEAAGGAVWDSTPIDFGIRR